MTESILTKTEDSLWYPYAQMKGMETPIEITSAQGVYLHGNQGEKLIDAISSWWCVIHGYSHPRLVAAAKKQIESFSHVMLGGLTHKPAQECAQKLVDITPEGLDHVFFSDSGSVGMEVAMKMAVQYWKNQENHNKTRFIALKKAYHGDTSGVMSICDPEEGMHHLFKGYLQEQIMVEAPRGGQDPTDKDLQTSLDDLEKALKQHADQVAAFVVEPLLQGAGGFNMYSPRYLNEARKLCDAYDVLLIFDEVATGFGRTGTMFAADQTEIIPDILTLGKGITGGFVGLSATLARSKVFKSFYSDSKEKAFMHGPTFMGNPLACAVAVENIALCEDPGFLEKIQNIESQLKAALLNFSAPGVIATRVMGATGVIEVDTPDRLIGVQEYAVKRGVWCRPFGTYLYAMPPYIINPEELERVLDVMTGWFSH